MWNLFKRKDENKSPYYGNNGPLLATRSAMPLRQEEPQVKTSHSHLPAPANVPPPKPVGPDWEQRRFDLVKMLVCQDRRSVVLGKLKASHKHIAANARALADAAIKELQTHQMPSDDTGGEETDG